MEVFAEDPATGTKHAVEVREWDTVGSICERAAEAVGLPAGSVVFAVCGEPLERGVQPAADCALLHAGCVLEVCEDAASYVRQINGGAPFETMPEWVRDTESCILAALHRCPENFAAASHRLRTSVPFVLQAMDDLATDPPCAMGLVANSSLEVVCHSDVLHRMRQFDGRLSVGVVRRFPELLGDRELLLRAMRCCGAVLIGEASAELRSDRDFILAAVKATGGAAVEYASSDLQTDRRFILQCVNERSWAFTFAHADLRDDFEVAQAALRSWGHLLRFCSARLQDHPDLVSCAVRSCPEALGSASPRLLCDTRFIEGIVGMEAGSLRYAGPGPKDNIRVVLKAVRSDGTMLVFASPRLKGNADVVLAAVRTSGRALSFAPSLCGNEAFVTQCAEVAPVSVLHAAPPASNSCAVWLPAVRQKPRLLECAPVHLRRKEQLVWAAVSSDWTAFQYAHKDLRRNANFVRRCVAVHGGCFAHADSRLRRCRDLALLALKTDGSALEHCDRSLRCDWDVVRAAVRLAPHMFQYASDSLRAHRPVVLHCVWASGHNLQHATAHRDDAWVVARAVLRSGHGVLRHVDGDVLNAPVVVWSGYLVYAGACAAVMAGLLCLGALAMLASCAVSAALDYTGPTLS